MHITVKIRNVYGSEQIYPVCEKAQFFAEIAGTKTLTEQTIRSVRKLGFEVVVQTSALSKYVSA